MPLALSALFILWHSWGALGGKQYTTSEVQGCVQPGDSLLSMRKVPLHSLLWNTHSVNCVCLLTKFSPCTGAVVLGFLECKNKLFIDGKVRSLLGMVACWLPAAPQPGGCLCFNESCFVSFSYWKKDDCCTVGCNFFTMRSVDLRKMWTSIRINDGVFQDKVCTCWITSQWHPHTVAWRGGSPVTGTLPLKWENKLALKVFWALEQFLLVLVAGLF